MCYKKKHCQVILIKTANTKEVNMKNANNNTLKDKQADIDVKILIAGDTGPTKSNMELFKRGNGEALFGSELIKLFNNHNYSIINLECDYLIVLYHGGVQEYRFPTPKLSIICKRMCDKGADLVICQHSQEKGFIEKKFDEYCSSKEADYFMACFGMKSIMRRIINRTTKGFLLKKWYGRRERLKVFNYITCEDHHEILQRIMGKGV